MIIACPACATRYVVPDSAIGAEGRTVRCAKCRHSWFQDGPALDLPPSPAETEPAAAPPPPPPPSPPQSTPAPQQQSAERAEAAAIAPSHDEYGSASLAGDIDQPKPPQFEDAPAPTVVERTPVAEPDPSPEIYDGEVSQFDYAPPFRPRRNMTRIWTIAAALFAVLALGTVAAVSYWGLPDWVPINRPTFALGQPDLVLDFPKDQLDRRTLPDGTEFFGISGTVKNVGRETLRLPPVLIVMSDARDRKVFSWEIAAPKSSIAPGETVTINQAVTDVPKSARFVEIGWKPN